MAKRKTLFDDRPVEINELTYVIKQDLSSLNSQISSLQSLSKSQQTQTSRSGAEQEGEHNKNVCTPLHIETTDYSIPIRSLCCCKVSLPTSASISRRSSKSARRTSRPLDHAQKTLSLPFQHIRNHHSIHNNLHLLYTILPPNPGRHSRATKIRITTYLISTLARLQL